MAADADPFRRFANKITLILAMGGAFVVAPAERFRWFARSEKKTRLLFYRLTGSIRETHPPLLRLISKEE
eukprot:jgi/Psemu1/302467/fgenesh1_kg.70_\